MSSPSGSDGEKEGALSKNAFQQPLSRVGPASLLLHKSPWPDGKFEAAWMDSDDEREAAKLNQKPSGQLRLPPGSPKP